MLLLPFLLLLLPLLFIFLFPFLLLLVLLLVFSDYLHRSGSASPLYIATAFAISLAQAFVIVRLLVSDCWLENLGCKHHAVCQFVLQVLRDRIGRGVKDCARFEA